MLVVILPFHGWTCATIGHLKRAWFHPHAATGACEPSFSGFAPYLPIQDLVTGWCDLTYPAELHRFLSVRVRFHQLLRVDGATPACGGQWAHGVAGNTTVLPAELCAHWPLHVVVVWFTCTNCSVESLTIRMRPQAPDALWPHEFDRTSGLLFPWQTCAALGGNMGGVAGRIRSMWPHP